MKRTLPFSRGLGLLWRYAKCSLLLLLSVVTGLSIQAAQFGDFWYAVNAGKVTITGYAGAGGEVSIPASIEGQPVTGIGYEAFYECTSLTRLTIPDSVTRIGSEAFWGCTALTSIAIGNGVTLIDGAAFWGCRSLTTVTLPDSVTSIGSLELSPDLIIGAFSSCSALTRVNIGSGLTSIGRDAFGGCGSLTDFDVDGLNPAYSSREGFLLNKTQDTLVLCPLGKAGNLVIPAGITTIGEWAFEHHPLTRITIPDGVTEIMGGAFHECTRLTTVILADSVTRLRSIPGEVPNYSYPVGAFTGCIALTSVAIGSSVTELGDATFKDCTALTSVTLPDSVITIGAWAFSHCRALIDVTIGNGVSVIEGGAFQECTGLTTVTIPGNVTSIGSLPLPSAGSRSYDPSGAFMGCTALTRVTLGYGVTELGDATFAGCTSLTTVTIPESVTHLANRAFDRCTSLTSITIPDTVTEIGCEAFRGCTRLTSIKIPDSVTAIAGGTFQDCTRLTAVSIHDSVTGIYSENVNVFNNPTPTGAFSGCTSLTSITIPDSVSSIGALAFESCTALASVLLQGSPPNSDETIFEGADNVTVYYGPGTTGWGLEYGGRPTVLWATLRLEPEPPLVSQPLRLQPGATVAFEVRVAGDPPIACLWHKDDRPMVASNRVIGVETSQLTIANVESSDAGTYHVVLTNPDGPVTSERVALAVGPVPGEKLWEFVTEDGEVREPSWSSPAIGADGTVYVGAVVDLGVNAFESRVYALHGQNGEKLWEFRREGSFVSSPAIGADGTVYVGGFGWVYALDGRTGQQLWGFATHEFSHSSPGIGADGTVYVGAASVPEFGRLYALSGQTGQKLWESETGDSVNSSPAVGADGTVYVGTHVYDGLSGAYYDGVYALDGHTGQRLWEFETGHSVRSSPAIGACGTVYVGCDDHGVYALNGQTGQKRWEFQTGNSVRSSPAIGADGTIYVGSDDHRVYALNGQTGQKLWEFETGDSVRSSPAVGADGTVYVGGRYDDKVYALDGQTGQKLWEFQTAGTVGTSPAIGEDGTVYVGDHAFPARIYAFRGTSPLASTPWPKFRGNAQNTGRVHFSQAMVATPTITPAGGLFSGSVSVSLSCATPGTTIRYTTDGSDPTSESTPYSGPFTLTNSATVKAKGFKSGYEDSEVASVDFTCPECEQRPFHDQPVLLPGRIEAEDFDRGGEGVAYHDLTAEDITEDIYRDSAVEVLVLGEGNGYAVGYTEAGEWLEYSVNVAEAGGYSVTLRVSRKSNGTGVGTLHLELDGEPLGAPFTIEPTGDWQSYANISQSGVSLPTGTHVLRVAFDESLPEQYLYIVNLDYVEFSREGPPLGIHRGAADSIVISWPASASGWELEENRDLGTDQWSIVGSVPVEVGDNLEVTISPGKTEGYYRLRKP